MPLVSEVAVVTVEVLALNVPLFANEIEAVKVEPLALTVPLFVRVPKLKA